MMPQSDFGICDRINHLMNEKCLTAAAVATNIRQHIPSKPLGK